MESIISSSSSSSKRATTRSPKITKKNKSKHPLRVVYISNPKKVSTTAAADFQATIQRLTGKGAVWNSDLEFIQTLPYANNDNNVSDIISDDSTTSDDVKDCGVEFPTPNLSPDTDTSAGSDDLCFQPLDHYDHDHGLLFFDLGFPVFNDQDLECSFQSDGLDFFNFPQC